MNTPPPRREIQDRSGRLLLTLRPSDQRTVAVLTLAALLVLTVGYRWHFLHDGIVEIEEVLAPPVDFSLDINQADWPELMLLPNIGETLAKRIVASRESEGPFRSREDLLRIRGIGPKTLAGLHPYLRDPAPATFLVRTSHEE